MSNPHDESYNFLYDRNYDWSLERPPKSEPDLADDIEEAMFRTFVTDRFGKDFFYISEPRSLLSLVEQEEESVVVQSTKPGVRLSSSMPSPIKRSKKQQQRARSSQSS